MQTNENAIEHIPVTEPERQYYFIEKCKDYVRKISEELRRPLTAAVITFGCQMNARDSEKLTGILEKIGYTMIDQEEKADFVIYNTCTVRENANQRVYGRLGQLNRVKRKNPHMLIGLCGCMMQEPHVVEKLKKSYRFVDLIFGTHNIYKFAEVLATRFESERMVIDIWKDTDRIAVCQRTGTEPESAGYHPGNRKSGSGRRERSHASGTECQFLWKDAGGTDDVCGAFTGSGKDRRPGTNPLYDVPSEGSVR